MDRKDSISERTPLLASAECLERSEVRSLPSESRETMLRALAVAERRLAEREEAARLAERRIRELTAALHDQSEALLVRDRELGAVSASGAWALAKVAHQTRRRMAPTGSRRHRALLLGLQAARVWRREGLPSFARKTCRRVLGRGPAAPVCALDRLSGSVPLMPTADGDYGAWVARNEPDAEALRDQKLAAEALGSRPLFSILTPVYNTPPAILEALIESVLAQTYDRWELCLVDGGSTDFETRRVLDDWASRESRVRVEMLETNRGISGNTNVALKMARGDFVALLDHDDLLAPFAFFEVARRLEADPDLDFLYSDKDMINEDGTRRFGPLFKPAWSPEIMLNANYLTHLNIMRTSLVREVGGFRSETDGAQDWDIFLRVLERTERVAHLPKVLYHWRHWSNSTSSGLAAKPYALEAQRRTLQEHLDRIGQDGLAAANDQGMIRIRPTGENSTKVSVVVTTSLGSGRLPKLIDELLGAKAAHGPGIEVELIIVHCGARTPQLCGFYEDITADARVQVLDVDGPLGSVEARQAGAEAASGQLLLFLSEDLEPIDEGWLAELVQITLRPGVGLSGAKIVSAEGFIEHAGLVFGLDGLVGPIYSGMVPYYNDCFGSVNWYRNYSAVSGDCLAIRRDLYESLGGFAPDQARQAAELDLCLRVIDRGLRVVYSPYAELRRVGPLKTSEISAEDLDQLHNRCLPLLSVGDPYFSPNLSQDSLVPRFGEQAGPRPARWALERSLDKLEAARQAKETPPAPRPTDPYSEQARGLVTWLNFSSADYEASAQVQRAQAGPLQVRSINWFIPDFHNAFYGGIYTILRFANHLQRQKGIKSRFLVVGGGDPDRVQTAIANAYPSLHDVAVRVLPDESALRQVEYADACISTLWTTAYYALKFNRTRRKFYFVQDYEPLFYPAGSTSAQVEATYRFGFYGLTNTIALKELYEREHGGSAEFFTPCVDTELFYPSKAAQTQSFESPDRPQRIFFYGRPNNLRNGFELGSEALRRLKQRLGDRVEILAAGDHWAPAEYGLEGIVKNLGLLSFDQTAELYRTCDAGLVLMFTRHPSYLPFEFMASGCLVVTNRNAATSWLLKDGENCLLTEPSADCIADTLERGLADHARRAQITDNALAKIRKGHADWTAQIEKIHAFMCDPKALRDRDLAGSIPRLDGYVRAAG